MIETKSPLLEDKAKEVDPPKYSEKEEKYLKGLKEKLESAKTQRDAQHIEFDGMDYVTYYNTNERLANTYVEPKRNKEDSNFQSGTIRTKLFALLSSVLNLDLSGDIMAYDKNGFKIQAMGDAMEDVVLKTNELDNDDEKKMLREYELLAQGSVFVEELWDERSKKEKKLKGKFKGGLNDVSWDTKIKKAFARPTRNIIPGLNLYLGDITKYSISDQPFIFTVETIPYSEAELKMGNWERWGMVSEDLKVFDNDRTRVTHWRLLEETEKNHVEIVRFQDKHNNEFAILANGILMTPVGLPLPWGYEDYNVAQQNLEPIHHQFAYGKSLVFRLRNKVAILDEMTRLGLLKTLKSYMPPRFNLSGRVVSNRVFLPGKMTHGVDPRLLPPADDKEVQGVTNAELAMQQQIQESIDTETTSPTFQGQQSQGNPTATEIVELQRQAKQMLGLTIFAMSMLEWKLEWLRLQNLLKNWFNPQDGVVDELRDVIREKYRQVSVQRPIENEGMGMRMVIPTKETYSPEAIMQAEDLVTQEQGMPVRFIFLNPDEVTSSKLCWQIVVTPREKKTSEAQKLLFRAFMADAQIFGPLLNMQYLGEEFANVWQKNPQKLFKSPEQAQLEQQQATTMENPEVSPQVNLPTPAKAVGQELSKSLQQ